jgi:hypothetical protein
MVAKRALLTGGASGDACGIQDLGCRQINN